MANIKIYDIRENYLSSPCGLDSKVKISYKVKNFEICDEQKECKIELSQVKDFSKIVYAKTYKGIQQVSYLIDKELKPVTKYYVRVSVKTKLGYECTGVSSFVTGKLNEKWKAKWITGKVSIPKEAPMFKEKIDNMSGDKDNLKAQYIRKAFVLENKIKEAYISICGVGYFYLCINGKKVGDDILATPFTRFDKTVMYLQYDISKYLKIGENVISVILGNGWYNCFAEDPWNTRQASWRSKPRMIAEIKMTDLDDKISYVCSNSTWRAYSLGGPIYFNGIRNGEHYDARKEMDGWQNPKYDDYVWDNCELIRSPGGELKACELEPIKIIDHFTAIKKWKLEDGSWVFDLKQNQAGFCTFKFRGKKDTEYTMIYSDVLKEDGDVDNGSIGCFIRSHGFQTDKYIKKSDDEETYAPIFVYHGFQYVKVQGFDYEPELEDVVSNTVCSGFDVIGNFSCSDDLLNQLQHLCYWSSISNMESIPTDCPHREKNGWTGDASISSEQMMTNFGSRAFFKKWNNDIREAQRPNGLLPCVIPSTGWGYNSLNGPDWSSAVINIPYNLYLYNNDIDVLKESYDVIKKHCDFMETMTEDYTLDYGLGDWCAPFDGPAISRNMGSFKCPTEVTDTGFFYNAACLVEKIANVIGYKDDAIYYNKLAKKIKNAFRNKYFDKKTYTVKGDCQTATACMLYFKLYENSEYKGLVNKLLSQIEKTNTHLDFGILGCKFVMNVLGEAGYGYIGQQMIAQRTYPGCKTWIDLGATTLWECWNGGGSHNHHMFSDLSSFMYKYVAGISPLESDPGFHTTIFMPAIECGMTSAKASHDSMYGLVSIDWQVKDNKVKVKVEIPFGCKGKVYLPIDCKDSIKVDNCGDITKNDAGNKVYIDLNCGKYTITAERRK